MSETGLLPNIEKKRYKQKLRSKHHVRSVLCVFRDKRTLSPKIAYKMLYVSSRKTVNIELEMQH